MSKILQVENLVQEFNLTKDFLDKVKFKNGHFSLENRVVHAVNNVSFDVEEGEVFSLVGESGCGKSTTARTIIKLIEPKSGKIIFDGRDITRLKPQEMRPIRREMQMIFQDPYASLNPRQKIMEILTEPMLFHKLCSSKAEAEEKAIQLLERVGLSSEQANRYPHQFSGGQRQRIGIARALAVDPEFIICDEPVSALDVSVQAQILNLLKDIQHRRNLSMLFISHDLGVVRYISDRVVIMYLGYICEVGNVEDIYQSPKHPYTEYLLQAVPKMRVMQESDEQKKEEASEIGTSDVHLGCPFYERCKYRGELCLDKKPEKQTEGEREFYCHYPISVEKR